MVTAHAQRGHQVVIGLDAAALAAAPIGVRGLDKMPATAQLAVKASDQAQQLFASHVGVFENHKLFRLLKTCANLHIRNGGAFGFQVFCVSLLPTSKSRIQDNSCFYSLFSAPGQQPFDEFSGVWNCEFVCLPTQLDNALTIQAG